MKFLGHLIFFITPMIFADVFARGIRKKEIIGGDDAMEGSYGYTVSIQTNSQHTCGGGIIGDYFILSAAHCFINNQGQFFQSSYEVLASVVDLSNMQHALSIPVETIYAHRLFKPQNEINNETHRTQGDIAVLRLKESLNIQEHPYLIKLSFSFWSALEFPGRAAIMTGFGDNVVQILKHPITGEEYDKGESFGRMRYANAKIVSKWHCSRSLLKEIHKTNICARLHQRNDEEHEGVCSGDSGGPLVRSGNVIIGVLSSSAVGCSEDIAPGVYTRVTSYRDFIKDAKRGIKRPDMRIANWIYFGEDCKGLTSILKEEGVVSDSDSSVSSLDPSVTSDS